MSAEQRRCREESACAARVHLRSQSCEVILKGAILQEGAQVWIADGRDGLGERLLDRSSSGIPLGDNHFRQRDSSRIDLREFRAANLRDDLSVLELRQGSDQA